ncbi:hypothetical protein [Candidatus Accumulibacter vicinus]|uniref:Uncharacterized protein n=1 Tax=Candidatus Accumulibacter vicinus TaxID=2954382 RepID=A0A084XUY5_9PROT|nr:hypothetical protein [Candidatus Accumulibacter vicinus]KFB66279.1 MAG: hypothetical protein CAPSK01_004440 [Candidatus Accumulibacter vicinus]
MSVLDEREIINMNKRTHLFGRRTGVGLVVATSIVSACYVVPTTGPDGTVQYSHYPLPPAGTPLPPPAGGATPATLTVRLYPSNEQATHTGVVSGSVTNMMTGKGRFVVNYLGEVLSGEATRVSNEEKRGVASAYSSGGMYMSCEYQMNTPHQGAGTCSFANGAKYQMHIGN